MKGKCKLPKLGRRLKPSKGACYCHASGAGESPRKKKGGERGALAIDIFMSSNEACGYWRIRAALERAGRHPQWPRRPMKALGLKAKGKRTRKHSSYKGEITPSIPNIIARDFLSRKAKREAARRICLGSTRLRGKPAFPQLADCFGGLPAA